MGEWIPDEEWETVVRNVPIVSVDLVVDCPDGIMLGKRTNEPAKGQWFIPGGRIQKGESRVQAVHRVAEQELGVGVNIVESLGAFEHVYDTSDLNEVDTKHYLANGYVVEIVSGEPLPNEQHDDLRVFKSAPESLHEHIHEYLDVSERITDWR